MILKKLVVTYLSRMMITRERMYTVNYAYMYVPLIWNIMIGSQALSFQHSFMLVIYQFLQSMLSHFMRMIQAQNPGTEETDGKCQYFSRDKRVHQFVCLSCDLIESLYCLLDLIVFPVLYKPKALPEHGTHKQVQNRYVMMMNTLFQLSSSQKAYLV